MIKRIVLVAALALVVTGVVAPASRPSVEERARKMLGEWKPRLEGEKFNYLVSGPFVIAGDPDKSALAGYCDNTVLASQAALRRMYIDKDLDEPVLILLIRTDGVYRRIAKEWLGEPDASRFGFYQPSRHVMLMNVSTGTGTLVHEVTHALVAPDFPDVPSWFNEGFASLFEQCSLADGKITGLVNWRLAGLQTAIREGRLRPLREMMADEHFYAQDKVGVNYAQARYLMLYLQEKGLLRQYYRSFRDRVKNDRNGTITLEGIVGAEKFDEFEKVWRQWVMGLRF